MWQLALSITPVPRDPKPMAKHYAHKIKFKEKNSVIPNGILYIHKALWVKYHFANTQSFVYKITYI